MGNEVKHSVPHDSTSFLFMTRRAISKRQQTGYGRRKNRRLRKCSSCKLLKPMSFYKPIMLNGKKVMPKTCKTCRDKRTQYYWAYESKHSRETSSSVDSLPELLETANVETPLEDCHSSDSFEAETKNEVPVIDNQYPAISLPPYPSLQVDVYHDILPVHADSCEIFHSMVDMYSADGFLEYFLEDHSQKDNSFSYLE